MNTYTVEDIKRQNPLPQIAEQQGVTLRKSGGGFVGLCPFHDDHNPSFSIFPTADGWGFKCYSASCGKRGDVLSFMGYAEYGDAWSGKGEQFKAVLRKLGGAVISPAFREKGPALPRVEKPRITPDIQYLWDAAISVCAEVLFQEKRVLAYLKERHFSVELLRCWRFGFWPRTQPDKPSRILAALYAAGISQEELLNARLLREGQYGVYEFFGGSRGQSGRILCADVDRAQRASYLLGRELPWEDGDQTAKYLGLADFDKPVLGLGKLTRSDTPVLLVEGAWNMFILHQWGYDAVAVSGADLSQMQVERLLSLKRPLIPVQDMDLPNAQGDIPGALAVEKWTEALPNLSKPILLPTVVNDVRIKDVNDLELQEGGQELFEGLVAPLGVQPSTKNKH
ncbi:MAG: hypothetical protein DWQ07_17525 [Chloroflexi bacterium]|nr:MAG: hypothetical protein DWQ07_17525 [Chloroflexota bacterium]